MNKIGSFLVKVTKQRKSKMISFKTYYCLFSTILNHIVSKQKLKNQIIELKYQNNIGRMEADIMGDQLKRLYDAITFLGEGKKHADKVQIELD